MAKVVSPYHLHRILQIQMPIATGEWPPRATFSIDLDPCCLRRAHFLRWTCDKVRRLGKTKSVDFRDN